VISSLTLEQCKDMAQSARRRAKRLRQTMTSTGRLAVAVSELGAVRLALDEAVATLRRQVMLVSKDSITERWLQLEIGDCLGTLGGLMRDTMNYPAAVDYYAKGRQCEIKVKQLGGVSNSYCLVQELVSCVLISSKDFWTGNDRHLSERIEGARAEVWCQIEGDRRRDPWAYADLALLTQITHPRDAIRLWYLLDEINPYRLVYESNLPVLTLLFESLRASRADYDGTSWNELASFFWTKTSLSAQEPIVSQDAWHAFH
jgi:hypothetical protein